MDLSYDDVRQILAIIDASSVEELRLEIGDLKLFVRKRGARAEVVESGRTPPATGTPSREPIAPAPAPAVPSRRAAEGEFELKAPTVGTFYRAPRPGAAPFVEVGSEVGPDDVVCIIEVMKLMNSITAGCRGRIVDIRAENGQLVEFGEPIMIIGRQAGRAAGPAP
jgi:acetyl-CoA carboxylase biotin carboxyl carrier protein